MRLYYTRDSVAAGDDADAPHPRELPMPDAFTAQSIVRSIARAGLPSIQGGKATWCVSSGVALAVIAQEWNEPRMLHSIPLRREELDIRDGVIRAHVSYFAQQDPQVVFDVLRRLTVRAM